jgi:Rrf2 family protein
MKIVDSLEAGLHTCLVLAIAPAGKGVPAARLAEYHALSATSLAKQLQQLAAAGIVHGSTGRFGGYSLARPAAEISVLDIVQALDGGAPGFRCAEIRKVGPCAGSGARYSPICAIAKVMRGAEAAWQKELGQTTLAGLVSGTAADLDPRIAHRTEAWMAEAAR